MNFGTRQPGDIWTSASQFLPSGRELSEFLANESSFPYQSPSELSDLAKVASYYVEALERTDLRERLRDVFNRDCQPGTIHTYLARTAAIHPLLIVTTNYDDLTERAFEAAKQPYDLVVHPTDNEDWREFVLWWKHGAAAPEHVLPNMLHIDLDSTTVIYKMHGTMDRRQMEFDSYVITEDDYVEFLTRMVTGTAVPMQFMRHFRERHFLFLGYGLQDWNWRVVLKHLRTQSTRVHGDATQSSGASRREEPGRRSWAIQFRPSDLEKELWDRRDVKIYDVDINSFVDRLLKQAP
ncbi:MAG: SIR2 family NAD-dependent protein deacylase [Chloroflexota bacterium]